MKRQDPPRALSAKWVPTPEERDELQEHEGVWFLMWYDATRSGYSSLRSWCRRHPGYEMTGRGAGDEFDIYMRYVGDAK